MNSPLALERIQCIGYERDELRDKAQGLATLLHCSVEQHSTHCLWVSDEPLALKVPGFSLLRADFSRATWKKRQAAGKKQGLIRACKPGPGIKIIDATAGWGRDAAILASFGADVLMVERHPIVAALLADALAARPEPDEQRLPLALVHADACTYLNALPAEAYPDIVYIDPMHPARTKSALVKKDLQVLQRLIAPDQDALELILCARTRVKQMVVVKWPQKVKPLLPPTSSISGTTVRFDIYTRT